MKKQSNLSRLMNYAGGYRILTYLSWVLSVMSALLSPVPFWYIWKIIRDILEVSPDYSQAKTSRTAAGLPYYSQSYLMSFT